MFCYNQTNVLSVYLDMFLQSPSESRGVTVTCLELTYTGGVCYNPGSVAVRSMVFSLTVRKATGGLAAENCQSKNTGLIIRKQTSSET